MPSSKKSSKASKWIGKIPLPVKGSGLRRLSSLRAVRKLGKLQKAQYQRLVKEFRETPRGEILSERVQDAIQECKTVKDRRHVQVGQGGFRGQTMEYTKARLKASAVMGRVRVVYLTSLLEFAEKKAVEKGLYKGTLDHIHARLTMFKKKKALDDSLEDLGKFL